MEGLPKPDQGDQRGQPRSTSDYPEKGACHPDRQQGIAAHSQGIQRQNTITGAPRRPDDQDRTGVKSIAKHRCRDQQKADGKLNQGQLRPSPPQRILIKAGSFSGFLMVYLSTMCFIVQVDTCRIRWWSSLGEFEPRQWPGCRSWIRTGKQGQDHRDPRQSPAGF